MTKSFTIARSPKIFNFSTERALAHYRNLAAKFRKYAELTHAICPRDARRASQLAKTYDKLADACEPEPQDQEMQQ